MTILAIPIAPLSRTKSRLRKYLSSEQLIELTLAMFKDLGNTLTKVDCFDQILVYCNAPEILEIAEGYQLIGIKEKLVSPPKSFDEVIEDLNNIATEEFNANQTIISFLDLTLISKENFYEINNLMKKNQLIICPAIHSAGISILGRKPPNVIPSYFSDPNIPSLFAILEKARKRGIHKIAIYDSFRAGFDIDVIEDLILTFEYMKIFNLRHTEVFKFLENNLKFTMEKKRAGNNRYFKIVKKK
jgi:2-phospho-L-lactate guanylyltransferase